MIQETLWPFIRFYKAVWAAINGKISMKELI
jgi:hypothetical protein